MLHFQHDHPPPIQVGYGTTPRSQNHNDTLSVSVIGTVGFVRPQPGHEGASVLSRVEL